MSINYRYKGYWNYNVCTYKFTSLIKWIISEKFNGIHLEDIEILEINGKLPPEKHSLSLS